MLDQREEYDSLLLVYSKHDESSLELVKQVADRLQVRLDTKHIALVSTQLPGKESVVATSKAHQIADELCEAGLAAVCYTVEPSKPWDVIKTLVEKA